MKELYFEAEQDIRDMLYELLEPQFGDTLASNVALYTDIPGELIEEKAIDRLTDMADRQG
jgi:hypothetical protein